MKKLFIMLVLMAIASWAGFPAMATEPETPEDCSVCWEPEQFQSAENWADFQAGPNGIAAGLGHSMYQEGWGIQSQSVREDLHYENNGLTIDLSGSGTQDAGF